MQGVSFQLWTEPFLEPFLGWQAGQGVPRCSVRDAQCSWHWEEQAPTWYLEMPTETHQLASPGAIREAEEGWENEPACSGCLTFSLFSTQPQTHLLAQVLQRAKPPQVRHPAGSREPSPHAHPITLQNPGVPDYLTWLPLSKPLESFSVESSPTSRDTSSLSPTLTSITRWRPERCRSETPLKESRIRFDLLGVAKERCALRLPLLIRERFFCPESRYPSRWCSRRPLLSAPARPVTPCSLSSTLSTPSFPLLCGSLGGIFGLEGGEPDPASDWRTPCRGGDGREMENGRDARSGQGEDAAGEEGARRSLASWLGSFFLNARFSRGPSRPPPPAPARGFEPRGGENERLVPFLAGTDAISLRQTLRRTSSAVGAYPSLPSSRPEMDSWGYLRLQFGPRAIFVVAIEGEKPQSSEPSPCLSPPHPQRPSPSLPNLCTASVTPAVSPVPPARH